MAKFIGKLVGFGMIVLGAMTGQLWLTAIGMSTLYVAGEQARRKAQEQAEHAARDAYNASLKDQYQMVRGSVSPTSIIYGRTRVSGPILYAESTGTLKDTLWLVVGLARHQIDAVETIYLDDKTVTLDGSGNATNTPWSQATSIIWTETYAISISAGAKTLPATPYSDATHGPMSVEALVPIGDFTDNPFFNFTRRVLLTLTTDYTVAGNQITFTSACIAKYSGVGTHICLNYAAAIKSYVKIKVHLGMSGQTADADLVAGSAGLWTTNHRLRGVAYLVVKLTYNRDVFPTGIPNVSAVVRGKPLYDPRTSTTAWSNNAALCVRDFLTSSPGFNLAGSAIDDSTVIASANSCDEQVVIASGPIYQTRYTCDGIISSGSNRATNLDALLSAMAGAAYYTQGKWKIRSGAAVSQVLTLNENNLADGAVQITPYFSRRDLFNTAQGKFLDAAHDYAETDVPPWSNTTFLAADGGVPYPLQMSFPMTTDSVRCQRLGKIRVTQSRVGYTIVAICNLSLYQASVGDGVTVTLARYGISAQPFRIIDRELTDKMQVKLTLVQDGSSVYAWTSGEQVVLPSSPSAGLPDPRALSAPTISAITSGDATTIINADGSITCRIRIDFNACNDQAVLSGGYLEVQYKPGFMNDWQSLGHTDPTLTTVYIAPVTPQMTYWVRAKFVNVLGVSSDSTSTTIVASGSLSAPTGPSSLTCTETGAGFRQLSWTASALDADCDTFELRYVAGSSATWATMSFAGIVPIGRPTTLAWIYTASVPATAGTFSFAVAAMRKDGSYSTPAYLLGQVLTHNVGDVLAASVVGQIADAQLAGIAASKLAGPTGEWNLIANFSFDDGTLDNWVIGEGTGPLNAVTISNVACMSVSAAGWCFASALAVQVVPGETYVVRVRIRPSGVAVNNHAYVRMQELPTKPTSGYIGVASGVDLRSTYSEAIYIDDLHSYSDNTWAQLEGTYTVPAGVNWVSVSLGTYNGTTGTIAWDSIEFGRQITAASIKAASITAAQIAAGTIQASNMVAGTITAASGIIADGAIQTAKIGDAQVSTLKIAGNAVTIPLVATSSSVVNQSSSWADALTLSMTLAATTNVLIDYFVQYGCTINTGGAVILFYAQVLVDGVQVSEPYGGSQLYGSSTQILLSQNSASGIVSLGSGTHTIKLQTKAYTISGAAGTAYVAGCSLSATAAMR